MGEVGDSCYSEVRRVLYPALFACLGGGARRSPRGPGIGGYPECGRGLGSGLRKTAQTGPGLT